MYAGNATGNRLAGNDKGIGRPLRKQLVVSPIRTILCEHLNEIVVVLASVQPGPLRSVDRTFAVNIESILLQYTSTDTKSLYSNAK